MQEGELTWSAVPRGNAGHYAAGKINLHRRIRVFPAYSILFYFYMIPRVELTKSIASRFHNTSLVRIVIVMTNLAFLFLVLLHDVVYFCTNKDFWTKYFAHGSRIITLLLSIRFILIFWKNAASVFLFLYKSKRLYPYLVELNGLVDRLPTKPELEKRQRIKFVFVYCFPFLCMGFRVAISIYALTQTRGLEIVHFGFFMVPLWVKHTFYHFAEIVGGITCIATYAQIATFVVLLKDGCAYLNDRLVALHARLKEEKNLPSTEFQTEVQRMRDLQEELIDLVNKHEDLFSLQILVAILNNAFVVFSSLASFFTPGVTTELVIIYMLSIVGFIYVILMLPFFHIQLNEESNRTIEVFQDIVHRRSQMAHGDRRPLEEFILMTSFLQRAMTKPLVVSAGGFMELTRSFVVSIGAVILGFALFLMERVEGQQIEAAADTRCAPNSTQPEWPIEDTPTLIDELVDGILTRRGLVANQTDGQ